MPTRLVEDEQADDFVQGRWRKRVNGMDFPEKREQRGEVGGPVVAEDADVDGEDVGAEGECIGARGRGYGFS